MKISDQSGKLIESHHLVYSSLMTWRLGKGIWLINFSFGTQKFKALEILIN